MHVDVKTDLGLSRRTALAAGTNTNIINKLSQLESLWDRVRSSRSGCKTAPGLGTEPGAACESCGSYWGQQHLSTEGDL